MATATATTFNYQVRDRAGKLVSGSLEADNQAAVAQKLRSLGYAPVSIEQVKESTLNRELSDPRLREEGQARRTWRSSAASSRR